MNSPGFLRLTFLLTLPPLLWAGNAVLGRILVVEFAPLALNALRWSLACLLLLPVGWRVFRDASALKKRWGYLCILGFLGLGSYNALQYAALQTSTPLNVTLIAASMPVWMLLLGVLFHQVRPHTSELAGASLSILGVGIVVCQGQWALLTSVAFSVGDLLMLLAVLVWAIYSWMLVRPPAHMVGAQRPSWSWAEFFLLQALFGTVWAILGAGIEAAAVPRLPPPGPDFGLWAMALSLLYLAIGPSILAFRAWNLGVSIVGPANAALFANLTPLFTAVLSLVLLGETPSLFHVVAFALIGAGIGVSAFGQHRRSSKIALPTSL